MSHDPLNVLRYQLTKRDETIEFVESKDDQPEWHVEWAEDHNRDHDVIIHEPTGRRFTIIPARVEELT